MYREQILDHYKHPRNFGELPDADVSQAIDNPLCGDRLKLQIKFAPVILNRAKRSEESKRLSTRSQPEAPSRGWSGRPLADFDSVPLMRDFAPATPAGRQDDVRIADAKFTGTACAISTASASLFTEFLKNKTCAELEAINENAIYELLGAEINPGRVKCALLPLMALEVILKNKII
ncbi:MAG: hypothetical protein A3H70_03405 [Candidatus Komeilibacteria bacterium RIFCSPLOWO2_02_FULL_48_11]|uniref:NIF system FeS cluster assembly NifU N-terminal domain-containing protein n=1 Tax=Candidatus Komeilibacteria bacterium RIFCSPLOWO2_02_FULL_48_11 TaxID=1798553 RepID=A0A1G2BT27_9BACT|nr:MAG: hypothetical protein A3H70_03405 [Candidatus Komeilibacteria bacterium RIFCSPLOWO2_02_FULL_48_11]